MTVHRVCAWCSAHIDGPKDAPTTHGICRACFEKELREGGLTTPKKEGTK